MIKTDLKFQFQWNEPNLEKLQNTASDGLFEAGEFILGKAKEIVPHGDTGMLEQSGETHIDEKTKIVTVSFGNTDAPYAIRQHEELGYKHKAGRQAKYLEHPAKEYAKQAFDIVKDKLRSIM